ncbi:MAG: hypothetical protein RTV41_09620 [Candidatus Thorarchaeota archaeon]
MVGKKSKLNATEKKLVRSKVTAELKSIDLGKWQKACKGFGPLNYDFATRKMWLEQNKQKISTARQIIKVIDKLAKSLGKSDTLEDVQMSAIRKEILETIRNTQKKEGLTQYKLNEFKLATFKTLIKWTDEPKRLEEGAYEGRDDLPEDKKRIRTRSRRGRKKEKGKYGPPLIQFEKGKVSQSSLTANVLVQNNYLHPYQNVELELNLAGATIKKVSPLKWNASSKTVKIGFIPADLDLEPGELKFKIDATVKKSGKSFAVSGKIHYDDCDKGQRTTAEFKGSIKV